ncbi:MAG: EAL domain-containing protein [Burkholderiales bacterium]|nr:EAL domain-containing protein [Burkholderiales bacterium]
MSRLLGYLSLRARLLLALSAILCIVLGVGGAVALNAARQVGGQALAQVAEREAEVLALSLTEPLILGDYGAVDQILRRSVQTSDITHVHLHNEAHRIEVRGPGRAASRPVWFAELLGMAPAEVRQSIVVGGRSYGRLQLTLGPGVMEDRLWRLLSRVAIVSVLSSLVLALAMWWIMRANLEGLMAIRHAARRLLEGDMDARVHLSPHAPPELRDTAAAINAAQSRLQQQLAQLDADKERWRVTLDSVGEGVVVTDAEGSVRFLNPVAERLTDWVENEALGRPVDAVLPLAHEDQTAADGHPAHRILRLAQHTLEGQAQLLTRTGARIPVHYTAAPITAADGGLCGAVLVLRDDSERRAMLSELRRLAYHDPLTGLPNRRAVEGRIERALRQLKESPSRQHAFFYIDLDQFKLVNDTCGHAAGDDLLRELAGVMQNTLPTPRPGAEPPVLGRLGGDEFGLLLFDTDQAAAEALANRFIEAIRSYTYRHGGRDFHLGASIGLILLAAGDDTGHVLARADAACYLAKRKGRNRVALWRLDDEGLRSQSEEMEWIGRLERYFAEGRFQLWRQRVVCVRDPTSEGYYEVLLRYTDASGVLRTPQGLLAAAERYGLAPSLDRWVVRQVIAYMRDHPECTARYAVNLSAQSLSDPGFVEFVRSQFALTGVDPSRLQFELTETSVVYDVDTARRFIDAMRSLGCGLALDDFGAGMSSFAYLKGLAADTIKIDGAFVRQLDTEPLDYVIVNAIAQIGRDLGLKTVAEFVETEAILEKLGQIGVDYAQGFHIHRPEPFIGPKLE